MRDIAKITRVQIVTGKTKLLHKPLPSDWVALKINGPLFFAVVDRVFENITDQIESANGLIINMDAVPLLDIDALTELQKLIRYCRSHDCHLFITDLQFQPLKALKKAGVEPIAEQLSFVSTFGEALDEIQWKYGGMPEGEITEHHA